MHRPLLSLVEKAYPRQEWPALHAQAEEWAQSRPLAGLRILDGTPIYRNTLAKYAALLAAGAELAVPEHPAMPADAAIEAALPAFGIRRVTPEEWPCDIALDCAGQFSHLHPRLGACELTRSGVQRYANPSFPVFVADSSRIKLLETSLGTGDGFFRALARLGYQELRGRKLLIVGLGKVGRGVLHYALQYGMDVCVADITPHPLPGGVGYVDATQAQALNAAILNSWCTVTTTGQRHALHGAVDAKRICRSQVLLANLGVEDEYGPSIPAERVLHRKQPLNFMLEEPTSMRFIETTMALHNACALLLAHEQLPPLAQAPPRELEESLLRSAGWDNLHTRLSLDSGETTA